MIFKLSEIAANSGTLRNLTAKFRIANPIKDIQVFDNFNKALVNTAEVKEAFVSIQQLSSIFKNFLFKQFKW